MNKGYTISHNDKQGRITNDGRSDKRYKDHRHFVGKSTPRYISPIKKKVEYVEPMYVTVSKAVMLICLLIANFFIWMEVYTRSQRAYEVIGVHQGEPHNDKNTICIGEMNKIFCKAWYGWDYEKIIKIATCESGLNPEAYNVNTNGSVDRGLMQINSIHGHKPSELFNPEMNVYHAYQLWKEQGYGPWYSSEHCWGI